MVLQPHPLDFYFLVLLGGGADWIAAVIFFRSSPLTHWTFAFTNRGFTEAVILGFQPADSVFRIDELLRQFWWFRSFCRTPPSALVSPVYRWRQASSRVLPFLLCSDLGRSSLGNHHSFSSALGGGDVAAWVSGEGRSPSFRIFPFQSFPQDPFS